MQAIPPLSALFARSPFKPMRQHMAVVHDCVGLVPGLFDALIDGDAAALLAAREAIDAKESEADAIKNDVRLHLPKSLFLPVDRRDLLAILEVQDSIADVSQDIAGLLTQRELKVLESMREGLRELVLRCVEACGQARAIIDELDELIETGFRGPEAARVEAMIAQFNQTETETDALVTRLLQTLFQHEQTMDPVSVMLWYQLIQWIGNLADNAEKVGERLLLLIAR